MKDFMNNPWLRSLSQHTDIVVAVMVLLIVGLIIIPLPSFLLDIFIGLNIALAVVILLLSIFAKRVLDFSVFPTMLLVSTLFRLALNISSTRLILSTGNPGQIVLSFGEFVTQGDMIVGAVIFIIIVIIQFLVITNGSTRVAEVSARFALDAMPGKQMAIDGDLNSGLIDERTAKRRREEVQIEAEFYGAMDGASKFVKGDAIAGIIIVAINFIGGIIIFMLKGYDVLSAVQKFGILTIGDGLVSQIPALLISVAAGIIVTRTPSENNLGKEISNQLVSMPQVVWMSSAVMAVLGIVPGLPFIPFMVLATGLGFGAWLLMEDEKQKSHQDLTETVVEEPSTEPISNSEDVTPYLNVSDFQLEFGYGLLGAYDEKKYTNLMQRILELRRTVAENLGIVVPLITIKDAVHLDMNDYAIKIQEVEVGRGTLYPNRYLVMNPQDSGDIQLEGVQTTEPVYQIPSKWIHESLKGEAERLMYTVVEDDTVLTTHLQNVIENHAHELLGRQELKIILDNLKKNQPGVVEDLIPDLLSLGEVLKVLQNLLKESVSIRYLGKILGILTNECRETRDIELLTERVRVGMCHQIVYPYLNEYKRLEVIMVNDQLENMVASSLHRTVHGLIPALPQATLNQLSRQIQLVLDSSRQKGYYPVFVVSPKIRAPFRRLIEVSYPQLAVLSLDEVPSNIEYDVIGMVSVNGN